MQCNPECQGKPDPAQSSMDASAHSVGDYKVPGFGFGLLLCFVILRLLHN